MPDFIVEQSNGTLTLSLDRSLGVQRFFLPLITALVATAITVVIIPPTFAAVAQVHGFPGLPQAVFYVLVSLCFFTIATLSYVQSLVSLAGKQSWSATSGRLEYHQELYGWIYAKRIAGGFVILTQPPRGSTSWKLIVSPKPSSEYFWHTSNIQISSDDDELRDMGNLLARATGWEFVDESLHGRR